MRNAVESDTRSLCVLLCHTGYSTQRTLYRIGSALRCVTPLEVVVFRYEET
jgi:hypothetical protein